jgi:hypothetical protein
MITLLHYTEKHQKMKAKKTTVGIINFVIFSVMVALGAGSGYYTGNYRIGIHIGMAVGLMGIALFRLWREKIHASLKDSRIPRSR